MIAIKVFTLFPEIFPGPLAMSLVGKALDKNIWSLDAIDIRNYATDKHRQVDDTTYGGGPGMVMRPDVIDLALKDHYPCRPDALIYLSASGTPLKQKRIKELAKLRNIGLLCGRFEGVDQRLLEVWKFEEISIGDFVLSGGEIPAMMLIDACVRLLPEVIGSSQSLIDESFSNEYLVEYPHYTRPMIWRNHIVPEVLLSGNHQHIKKWRQLMAEKNTREYRPDLWQAYLRTKHYKDETR